MANIAGDAVDVETENLGGGDPNIPFITLVCPTNSRPLESMRSLSLAPAVANANVLVAGL